LKPLPERLNDRLERQNARSSKDEESPSWLLTPPTQTSHIDTEVDELVDLAHRFQSASPLEVDPDFARQLEQRVLMHNAALRLQQFRRRRLFPRLWDVHPFFGVALSICILLFLLGTGALVVAAQVSNPDNPLYAVKRLEQHVQVSLSNSSENQAEMDLQSARDRLDTLAKLIDSVEAYKEGIADLDQQISTASKAINALPAGRRHDRLVGELAAFEADVRSTLRRLLPKLAFPERLVTSSELGYLGDNVPRLKSVAIALPAHPNGRATISISGQGVQPGAQLLVDGRLVIVQGSLQNGLYVFVADWVGNLHPQSVGILNPDGTAALTSAIILKTSDEHDNVNGNSNSGGNGNGNGGVKPNGSPTPRH
jgi:uncharacterized protein DUF5667